MSGCIVNCTNRGNCKYDSPSNKYVCACDEYFSGKSCEIDTRACSSNPCMNNATCIDVYSNSSSIATSTFRCECQIGYEGDYCETKLNICANETCSNNGNCEDLDNVPKCKCFSMYEGEKCDVQSSELKTIKTIVSMTSIIAVAVIICFFLLFKFIRLFKYGTAKNIIQNAS